MRATRLVTVLLPLVPVMPITGACTLRANSSTSPSTSMPRSRAARAMGSSSDTPGDMSTCDAPSSSDKSKPPSRRSSESARPPSSASPGGVRRVSVALTGMPRFAR